MTVIQDDALQHLSELDASSLGGIFCAHVIEHLDPDRAIKLLHECRRVLNPGGILILITPNAKDLRITERFWLDVTHIRPYPEKLLIALLEHEGFSKIRTLENREPSRNFFERTAKFIIKIWFLGYMFRGDLVVIAEIDSSAG